MKLIKGLITLAVACVVAAVLSGCLATVGAIGAGLSAATIAGCEAARQQPNASPERVRKACGSIGF